MNDIKYMQIAIKEAKKAYRLKEVPIGAIIVRNNKIISKAYNKKEKTNKVTAHAELLAIEKACKKLKTWHLNDCIMYTTVEPCLMCTGAIIQSRISKVYASTKNEKFGSLEEINIINNAKIDIEFGLLEEESIKLLKDFFALKRK